MFSADRILQGGNLLLVGFIIFAETGLLFGFIFPGDTLLVLAGYLASHHRYGFNIASILPTVILAAILGYETGYEIGRRFGNKVFSRQDGLLFRTEYVDKTRDFLSRHGGKTILLARFVPYVRTFVSAIAGVAKMDRRMFVVYNLIGGVLWAGGVTMAGYWLGNALPKGFDAYIILAAIVGLALFHGGTFWHIWRNKDRRAKFMLALKQDINHYILRR